jgi:hypothetical protein
MSPRALGRYRYHYQIDGIDVIDENASTLTEVVNIDLYDGSMTINIPFDDTGRSSTHPSITNANKDDVSYGSHSHSQTESESRTIGSKISSSSASTIKTLHPTKTKKIVNNVVLIVNPVPKPSRNHQSDNTFNSSQALNSATINSMDGSSMMLMDHYDHFIAKTIASQGTKYSETKRSYPCIEHEDTVTNMNTTESFQEDMALDTLDDDLYDIDLRNLSLCDDGASALSTFVKPNRRVHVLNLSNNMISDDGILGFAACLPSLYALHTLR